MKKTMTSVPFTETPEQKAKLDAIIDNLKEQPGCLMPIMQQAQDVYGYLPPEVQKYIANKMLNERSGSDRDYLCGTTDIHEADTSFQAEVYYEYMKLVDLMDDFVAVKCYNESGGVCSIEEIHKRICNKIMQ